jgi:SWI2/SNF2 ATPase
VVFETKKGKTTKTIARYQQFEAVNELVDRTVSQIGRTVSSQDRTGLIWHTQGSGKSLTMVFAGQKLRRHPALRNPTVLIVVDRRDLKTQLSDDFDACDYPNVEKALACVENSSLVDLARCRFLPGKLSATRPRRIFQSPPRKWKVSTPSMARPTPRKSRSRKASRPRVPEGSASLFRRSCRTRSP